jgi:hypothetical protein
MNWLLRGVSSRQRGAALLIVLAFVVLLTGLGVAYLSRTTTDRQVAHSSFNQSTVDQLAQSAMDNIIGDLRREILYGSGSPSPTASPVSLFVPTSNANMMPMRNVTAPAIPNLIRRSVRSESSRWPNSTVGPAVSSRASEVNSYSDLSANGRSITLARWNSHYLIPKSNTTDAGSDPITTGFDPPYYWAPDWVFVAPDPTNQDQEWRKVITQADQTVIGRYAYAIYDEGGLLDMNAAGYPSPTTILQYGRKGSLAFADLTGLPGFALATVRDNFLGWRNYGSSQLSGTLPNLSFSADSTNTYYNFILSDPNYIQLKNYFTGSPLTYFTNSFLTTSGATVSDNRTDQGLIARQELIKLRSAVSSGISFSNALKSLGTFSREALANVPQWSPTTPDSINPTFQTLLVTNSFTRNDGTIANVGDPYVSKRFLLQRLNWLTYKGPSATRNIPTSAPALGNPDYDMWLLTRSNGITFGLTRNFLLQGTATNILKYFGLVWDAINERWNYTGPSGGSLASNIASLGTLTGAREPDFFELLQAGILNSSLGDAFSSDPALPSTHQASKMLHILTIGANLIAQSHADSYPVRIACNVTVNGVPTGMEAVGMPQLPCLSSLAVCPVGVTQNAGGVNWLLVPNLWNPFRDTWDLTELHAHKDDDNPNHQDNTWLTPGYLRPPVRITVKGGVGFGYASAAVSQSGSVNPDAASVTLFPSQSSGASQSLLLATGNSRFGRDGLREAMRLGVSDVSSPPNLFDPTTSPGASIIAEWRRVARPANDVTPDPPYRSDDFIVFRLSLPGNLISRPDSIGKNPVLRLLAGFQVSLDYQSPTDNTKWYPYSFLQGNNVTNTWISSDPVNPSNLSIGKSVSQYGQPGGYTNPTIFDAGTATPWNLQTLGQAPMFAKADPRSIRYNSMIGVANLANPPMSFTSAAIIGSIWPSPYATPAPMTPSAFPVPTPAGSPNPALYSQLGDNSGDHGNPYSEAFGTADLSNPYRPVMMNRPFRSVGEMAYAFRDQPFRTLSFSSINSPDAGLLDLFTTNDYSDSSGLRGGVISLNSHQAPALAAVLSNSIRREDTPRVKINGPAQSPSPSPLGATDATNAATTLISLTSTNPVKNIADLATLIANTNPVGFDATVPKTQRESIARALGETTQTRTWNLLIDVIAQTGRYPPNATSLQNGFVVDGEQRFWVHVAIDRFTGQVVDKQIEVVNE